MESKWKIEEKRKKTTLPPRRGQIKEKIFEELKDKITKTLGGGGNVRKNQVSSSSQDHACVLPTKK